MLQHTMGIILDYDPITFGSVLSKNEIGLNLVNDSTAWNSNAEHDEVVR